MKQNDAASCSSTACHGGPRAGVNNASAERGSEYPQWLSRDPHSRAYRTLSSPLAEDLFTRMGIMSNGHVTQGQAFQNCLRCHSPASIPPIDSELGVADQVALIPQGVDCDSCHGPSQLWRTRHYREQAELRHLESLKDEEALLESAQLGWVMNKHLLVRARMCASCHVGDADRRVDHEMLAAGHPRLNFEMASYHAQLPKHWRDDAASVPDRYEPGLWMAGQLASLDAHLAQLESSVAIKQGESGWPDFSVYSCNQCHRTPGISQQTLTGTKMVSGQSPQWSAWHRWGLSQIIAENASAKSTEAQQLLQSLDQLYDELSTSSQLSSKQAQVSLAAERARRDLDRWLRAVGLSERHSLTSQSGLPSINGQPVTSNFVLSLLRDTVQIKTWEDQSQFYLALLAARATRPREQDREKNPLSAFTHQLRTGLLFDPKNQLERYQPAPQNLTTIKDIQRALR